jgi:hypothetical protein
MSPHYRAARDGNKTIPENYIDKEYQAPSFSVNLNKVIPYGSFFYAFNRLYLPSVYSEWRR